MEKVMNLMGQLLVELKDVALPELQSFDKKSIELSYASIEVVSVREKLRSKELELSERETKVTNREAAQATLSRDLSLARARASGSEEREKELSKKLNAERQLRGEYEAKVAKYEELFRNVTKPQ